MRAFALRRVESVYKPRSLMKETGGMCVVRIRSGAVLAFPSSKRVPKTSVRPTSAYDAILSIQANSLVEFVHLASEKLRTKLPMTVR